MVREPESPTDEAPELVDTHDDHFTSHEAMKYHDRLWPYVMYEWYDFFRGG